MRKDGRFRRLSRSLQARLAVMLSIAILPLGLVALFQTSAVVNEAARLEENDILARTVSAVARERDLFQRAYGATTGLGAAVVAVGADSPECTQIMQSYLQKNTYAAFAGFTQANGQMACSSTGTYLDFSDFEDWQSFIAEPRPMVAINREGAASGQSVVIVTMPIYAPQSDQLVGAASISMPHDLTDTLLDLRSENVALALIDERGEVLTASTGIEEVGAFEATGIVPAELTGASSGLIERGDFLEDSPSLAALVPLVDDRIFVLGLWPDASQTIGLPLFGTTAPIFPILMWLTTLGVALFAVNSLVLRHLSAMRRRMTSFSPDAPMRDFIQLNDAPIELDEISNAYNNLLATILSDRKQMEDDVQEKETLLREIHHRVKNNLQLISSILNMQIRTIDDASARTVLRRVQDRVMSLSAIHKALYSDQEFATVRADRLLEEVIHSVLSIGLSGNSAVEQKIQFARLELDADQAVPFALLANELVTNAVKYVGSQNGAKGEIAIALSVSDGQATFSVCNSCGERISESHEDGTGLGSRLIEAFVTQLDGATDITETESRYKFEVSFPILQFEQPQSAEPRDLEAAE